MNRIKKIYSFFCEKQFKFFLSGSKVTIEKGGFFKVGKNVSIKNSTIYVKKGNRLIIGDNTQILKSKISMILGIENEIQISENCVINEFNLSVTQGAIYIGKNNILQKGDSYRKPKIEVDGSLHIGSYNRLRCSVWTRFKAELVIGSRNAINEGTEIRCDQSIKIGDYNQISYNCVLWDTNTHNMYKAIKRRDITNEQYPDFGLEFEKPKTAPISIGNDCWLGKEVSILKGTSLADKCIVGYGTLLSNIKIDENKTIFNQPNLKISDNKI